MWHRMVEQKRNEWLSTADCPISGLISYINAVGQMRDAQVDAIKTYIFLKIVCDNKPLNELFSAGVFNFLNLNNIELTQATRDFLANNPAATALLEYASQENDHGEQVAPKVVDAIKQSPEDIDYQTALKDVFYGISYTDYLFSLPMGAGKTYLMAAFIYLDLYFAQLDPTNPAFAHNFMIFAPSGLKSSVVPSLKTIERFNPAWVIPEPSATNLKRLLSFEVLDQGAAAKKSNRTRNPNVQKVNLHQPFEYLMGLVCVTNAEKVILDRVIEKDGMIIFQEESDGEKNRSANELRNIIGKLPNLSVFIDEVHHAVSEDIKLRAVVARWADGGTFNSVIGFSGTPYLDKQEKIAIGKNLVIANKGISNIVYYYPLVDGIGNFLKKPTVYITEGTSAQIVEAGTREFLNRYKDTTYENGLIAKLGIYCGTIERLEEEVYPLVESLVTEYGLDPTVVVLKFHRGNKVYPVPLDSQMRFDTLDTPLSKARIVLLVQIGKEGWDCTSLTGVVLSQEGDCPTNMVLQTSCRCLRQVTKGQPESALIYLNEGNGTKINAQLEAQQHISLQEFQRGAESGTATIKRYDRTNRLKLPKLDFYQLRVNYREELVGDKPNTDVEIETAHNDKTTRQKGIVHIREGFDLSDATSETIQESNFQGQTERADFNIWVYGIAKGSFGFISVTDLLAHKEPLLNLFKQITLEDSSGRYFLPEVVRSQVDANIRTAFYEKRSILSTEELIPTKANLLHVENFTSAVKVTEQTAQKDFYPDQHLVGKIILDDQGELTLDDKTTAAINALEAAGQTEMVRALREGAVSYPMKDRTFHYLPYRTDSSFEQTFLAETLKLDAIKEHNLEVYYNGDSSLTEFSIRCYRGGEGKWRYLGMYTPDFLIIQRKENAIYKAVIVETKGEIYANDPRFTERRHFMEHDFVRINNEQAGYERFDYLYLEDTLSESDRLAKTIKAIDGFFGGDN